MCSKNLSTLDLQYLDEIETCEEFQVSLEQMHSAFVHMSRNTLINRLNPCLSSLKNFLTLLAVAMGSTPVNTAIIWGILSLVVEVNLAHVLCGVVKLTETDRRRDVNNSDRDYRYVERIRTRPRNSRDI